MIRKSLNEKFWSPSSSGTCKAVIIHLCALSWAGSPPCPAWQLGAGGTRMQRKMECVERPASPHFLSPLSWSCDIALLSPDSSEGPPFPGLWPRCHPGARRRILGCQYNSASCCGPLVGPWSSWITLCLPPQVNIVVPSLALPSSGLSLASAGIRSSGAVKVIDGECGLAWS